MFTCTLIRQCGTNNRQVIGLCSTGSEYNFLVLTTQGFCYGSGCLFDIFLPLPRLSYAWKTDFQNPPSVLLPFYFLQPPNISVVAELSRYASIVSILPPFFLPVPASAWTWYRSLPYPYAEFFFQGKVPLHPAAKVQSLPQKNHLPDR